MQTKRNVNYCILLRIFLRFFNFGKRIYFVEISIVLE